MSVLRGLVLSIGSRNESTVSRHTALQGIKHIEASSVAKTSLGSSRDYHFGAGGETEHIWISKGERASASSSSRFLNSALCDIRALSALVVRGVEPGITRTCSGVYKGPHPRYCILKCL